MRFRNAVGICGLLLGATHAVASVVVSIDDTRLAAEPVGLVATVPAGAAPWVVSLRDEGGRDFCGGVLVAPDGVLTTAVCALASPAPAVVAGADGRGGERRVVAITAHPGWQAGRLRDDLAVLRLAEPYALPVLALPAQAPRGLAEAERLLALGRQITYRAAGARGSTAPQKHWHYVELPHVSRDRCEGALGVDLENTICAGHEYAHYATCQGDSGGPLLRLRWGDDVPELLGLTSWGKGCGGARDYSVHVAIWPYREWIRQRLAE